MAPMAPIIFDQYAEQLPHHNHPDTHSYQDLVNDMSSWPATNMGACHVVSVAPYETGYMPAMRSLSNSSEESTESDEGWNCNDGFQMGGYPMEQTLTPLPYHHISTDFGSSTSMQSPFDMMSAQTPLMTPSSGCYTDTDVSPHMGAFSFHPSHINGSNISQSKYTPQMGFLPQTPFPQMQSTHGRTSSKRSFSDTPVSPTAAGKRRKSVSTSPPTASVPMATSLSSGGQPKSPKTPHLTDDDALLLKLKDVESLPWKLIQKRFLDLGRGEFKVPTLQMRYKRLKEKMRVWDADDLGYLKEAKEAVAKEFWENVSKKMLELGCRKKIPGGACERKWREIEGATPRLGHEEQPQSPKEDEEREHERNGSVVGLGLATLALTGGSPRSGALPLPSMMVRDLGMATVKEEEVVEIKQE